MDDSDRINLAWHLLLTVQLACEASLDSLRLLEHNVAYSPIEGKGTSSREVRASLQTSCAMLNSRLLRTRSEGAGQIDELNDLCHRCDRTVEELLGFFNGQLEVERWGKTGSSSSVEREPVRDRMYVRSKLDDLKQHRASLNEKITFQLAKDRMPYFEELRSAFMRDVNLHTGSLLKEIQENRMAIQNSKSEQMGVLVQEISKLSRSMTDRSSPLLTPQRRSVSRLDFLHTPSEADDDELRPLDGMRKDLTIFEAVAAGYLPKVRDCVRRNRSATYEFEDQTGRTALHIACMKGEEACAAFLLSKSPDFNAQDNEGMTPLHYAVRQDCASIVRLLLRDHSAATDLGDNDGKTPAEYAKKGSEVEFMLEHGPKLDAQNKNGLDAINFFAEQGDAAAVISLLKQKASVNSLPQDGQTPLHRASRLGHLEVMRALLSSHPETVNAQRGEGTTPLHEASRNGQTEAIKVLMECGADIKAVDDQGFTALQAACRWDGSGVAAGLLLEHGADPNARDGEDFLPLNRACKAGQTNVVLALLGHNVDPNLVLDTAKDIPPLMEATIENHVECVKVLLDHGADPDIREVRRFRYVPLHRAAILGHLDIARELLTRGKKADPSLANEDGMTAAHEAVAHNHASVLELVLSHGASPNIRTRGGETIVMHATKDNKLETIDLIAKYKPDMNLPNYTGRTPIVEAASRGNREMVRLLMKHGADPNAREPDGKSALIHASKEGHLEVVRFLLDSGAVELEQKDCRRWTALLHAACRGRLQVAEELMFRGADPTVQQDQSKDALFLARENNHPKIVKLVEDVLMRQRDLRKA